LDAQAAAEVLLAMRLSNPQMTLVLALHEQQLTQLSWIPDQFIRLDQSALTSKSFTDNPGLPWPPTARIELS
jgi:hypothetical protein